LNFSETRSIFLESIKKQVMARSVILPGDKIDKLACLGLPLWERGWGDF